MNEIEKEIEQLKRHISSLEAQIEEMENPMACGHYGANLQPDDSNNDFCVVCVDVIAKDAEIERLKKQSAQRAAGFNALRCICVFDSHTMDDPIYECDYHKGLRAEIAKLREYILHRHNSDHKDYACEQCDPGGEVVQSGFVCVYHQALGGE